MMRYIKQWQVDLFAVPITLNHEGREKAKSFHGAFITLLFAGFIVWFIYSLSKQMFSHQNPNTITFDTFQEIPDPIELNKDTFPFAIGMQLPSSMNLAYFRDEQIYIPVVKLLVFTVTENSDGTTTKNRQILNVETEPCTLAHFGSASQNVKKLPLSSLYCIKPEQTNLKKIDLVGKQDFSTYKAFYIAIQKCANTTTTTCKSPEEISQKLTLSWINIIYMQSAINPQNFTDPNQRFAATYTTMLSPTMLKSGIIKLNHLNVIDDDGWLFENKKTKNFIKVDNPVENFNLQPDPRGYLYSGVLELGQVVTTYERRYTKLQTVLAQIQGSAATVVLALIIILRPYSEVKFQETLINELFDVQVKKKDDPKGKNKKNANKTLKKKNSKLQVQELEIPQQPGLVKRFSNQVAVAVNKGIETIQKSPGKEGGGYFHLGSDRPLKSPKEEKPEEQEQDKGKTQSFKMLLNSIQNDSPINFSKTPQTVEQRALLDLTKLQESSIDSTRKYDKGLSLAIEKPGQIKLEALSERISDGPDSPRNVSDISIKEEDKKQTTPEIECLPSPPLSPQNGADIQGLISLEVTDLKQEDETQDEENLNYESAKIDISIWEFFSSFVRKSAKTKEKFDVLNKGMKNVRERMDILNIMKKFRELDKLKALLLEEDQLILFNAMPKAEIRPGEAEVTANDLLMSPRSFSQRILKRSAFIEMNENQESLKKAHDKIQMKAKKSKIDARLLELYNNMLQRKKNNSRANIS